MYFGARISGNSVNANAVQATMPVSTNSPTPKHSRMQTNSSAAMAPKPHQCSARSDTFTTCACCSSPRQVCENCRKRLLACFHLRTVLFICFVSKTLDPVRSPISSRMSSSARSDAHSRVMAGSRWSKAVGNSTKVHCFIALRRWSSSSMLSRAIAIDGVADVRSIGGCPSSPSYNLILPGKTATMRLLTSAINVAAIAGNVAASPLP